MFRSASCAMPKEKTRDVHRVKTYPRSGFLRSGSIKPHRSVAFVWRVSARRQSVTFPTSGYLLRDIVQQNAPLRTDYNCAVEAVKSGFSTERFDPLRRYSAADLTDPNRLQSRFFRGRNCSERWITWNFTRAYLLRKCEGKATAVAAQAAGGGKRTSDRGR